MDVSIDRCNQGVAPDVEFSFVKQDRIFNVLLNDVRPLGSTLNVNSLRNCVFNTSEILENLDPSSPVGVLTWLDNPYVLIHLHSLSCLVFSFNSFLDFIKHLNKS